MTDIADVHRMLEAGQRVIAREANLSRANLLGADLRGADLRGADLREADLREADLRWANLYGADLREANLSGADLRGAYLRGADLSEAYLPEANLSGANLYGADLRWANLRGANLRGAYLPEANLSGAAWNGLRTDGLPSRQVTLTPTPSGWKLEVGCWSGTIETLRELIAQDDDWPGATPEEIPQRRPALEAVCDLLDAHIAANPDVITDLAERWSNK